MQPFPKDFPCKLTCNVPSWSKKVLWFCWKLAQMKFRTNKFSQFWNIRNFFCKIRKKSDFKFEIWEIFGFFFKIPLLQRPFFSKKNLAQNWLRWSSEKINFRNFRVFWFCSKNVEKNPIQVRNFGFFFKIPLLQRPFFSKFSMGITCKMNTDQI